MSADPNALVTQILPVEYDYVPQLSDVTPVPVATPLVPAPVAPAPPAVPTNLIPASLTQQASPAVQATPTVSYSSALPSQAPTAPSPGTTANLAGQNGQPTIRPETSTLSGPGPVKPSQQNLAGAGKGHPRQTTGQQNNGKHSNSQSGNGKNSNGKNSNGKNSNGKQGAGNNGNGSGTLTPAEFRVDIAQLGEAKNIVAKETEVIRETFDTISSRMRTVTQEWASPAGAAFAEVYSKAVPSMNGLVAILDDAVKRMGAAYETYEATERQNTRNVG